MRNLLEIDELISESLAARRQERATVEQQLAYIDKQIGRLKQAQECEHEPRMKNSERDHCLHCGYEWVR
ncbi:hypothetical protein [Halomonas sp. NO4]|uniref:hypothetical protein n=1 Tax=Halomonas sp. NO4 TaxID=2484813 RepID=UPI0013D19857|nr:hypothetical protein [Halomonas sp. NO4]